MNKIVLHNISCAKTPQIGDFFIAEASGEVFILTNLPNGFCAISLKDGGRWDNPTVSAEKSVQGLKFLGNGLTVILSN